MTSGVRGATPGSGATAGTARSRSIPLSIPDDLAEMAPGSKLAAALAGIDGSAVCGTDSVTVLQAHQRQANHTAALRLSAIAEVAVRAAGSVHTIHRMQAPDRYSPDEIRAALALSRPASEKLMSLAWDVVHRLPELHAAMVTGDLDEQRAWALAKWTTQLSDEHAHAVCAELLPRCSITAPDALTTAQLIDKARTLAMALDPDWAEKTYSESVRRRCVLARRNDEGTANLSGYDLDAARVAAAVDRINHLAKKARRDRDPRTLDQLRADLFLGMLDGSYESLSDEQILADLAAHRPEPEPEPGPAPGAEAAPAPAHTQPAARWAGSPASWPHASPEDKAAHAAAVAEAAAARAATTADHHWAGPEPDDAGSTDEDPAPPTGPAPTGDPRWLRSGLDLRIELSTLLGLDRHPGELLGSGPVHAGLAIGLAQRLGGAQWVFALADNDGHLTHTGLLRARPIGVRRRDARHRGTVQILLSAALLDDLRLGSLDALATTDPATMARWAPVLADLARRARFGALTEKPDQRFPHAALRRQIQNRIPHCLGVGCRRPAGTCEIDHRLDYGKGGKTLEHNLGPACGHDHDLKTRGGWRLDTHGPNHLRWTTRLGRRYVVEVPPVIDCLPDPIRPPRR